VVHLSKDKFLVTWKNGAARVFERSLKTGKFYFGNFSVSDNNVVLNAFTAE